MLARSGGCGTEESQKGVLTSNKKDLRSPRHLNNLRLPSPFPSHLLAGHQWFRDAGLSGSSSEDTRHARFRTGAQRGSEARDFSKS